MFTGIIQEVGRVVELKHAKSIVRLTVYSPKIAPKVHPLESVAVNGVCLTVVARKGKHLMFEVIPETQQLTSLALLHPRSLVNLEPSLPLTGRFNGHVVLGHVDGTGKVVKSRQKPGERVLTIQVDRNLRRYLVPKGPVTVDGVSLTVGRKPGHTAFTVHLIPKTLKATSLAACRSGSRVNIEVDYFAKLFAEWLKPRVVTRY